MTRRDRPDAIASIIGWALLTICWIALTIWVDWRLTVALACFAAGDNLSESLR